MNDAYKQAGVDIEAGYEVVKRIKKYAAATKRPEVLTGLGGFGALFELPIKKYKNPVLVSGTDGVGTKLNLAFQMKKHDTIGIDVVAMCVNDIAVLGAEPLYFLDYLACGKNEPWRIEAIVKGVAEGCEQAGCSLIGGETAEMPGFYKEDEYDIAGFAVGIVEKDQIIDGSSIVPGDVVIGIASSGLHSNGFSLVRKVLEDNKIDIKEVFFEGKNLGEVLLTPTKIYVKLILDLISKFTIKGMAHITGGGFYENLPRILPEGCGVEIKPGSWQIPSIFSYLQDLGNISEKDMFNTFNMGIGLALVVSDETASSILDYLATCNEQGSMIGRIVAGEAHVVFGGK
ncbi:MAG: phosphoribosylformylglycinamidine cyclo-ligase [Firmicutes bacterium]|nr:phosphoribosylformylglycinamidine cyclo-ligase [Bacillota bacterium]